MSQMNRKNCHIRPVLLLEALMVMFVMSLMLIAVIKSFHTLNRTFFRDSRAVYAQARAADLKSRWRHILKDKTNDEFQKLLGKVELIKKQHRKWLKLDGKTLAIPNGWRAEVKFEPHKIGADCAVLMLFKLKKSKRRATTPAYKMRIVAALSRSPNE
jgi:hypothetical protein